MYCKNFSELSKHDAAIAGGKGASLGEMTSAFAEASARQECSHNPVPLGFVVLADAFEKFLEETDLNVEIDAVLHSVDTKAMHTVEHASETIQKLILEAKMPEDIASKITADFQTLDAKHVAVRSSATAEDSASAAWAGQLDSFLNTTEETLLRNVQRCWASLFTPRAVFYRFEQGLHDSKISVAVVVQKMIQSEISGIAFSVHPVTEDYNQLIIEAGYGLGEAIVSGQITPDSYVVEKNLYPAPTVGAGARRIIDKNIAEQERGIFRLERAGAVGDPGRMEGNEWRDIPMEKRKLQKLSDEQIFALSEIIIGIENHYGFPCDIEWAFQNNTFYIVQSRPITTLSQLQEKTQVKELTQGHKVNYQKHQRDYTLLATTVVFNVYLSPRLQEYFSFKPSPMYVVVDRGELAHYINEDDSFHRASSWASKYGEIHALRKQKIMHDKILSGYRQFLRDEHLKVKEALALLYEYFAELLPLILVAIEVPEYAGDAVDKEVLELCAKIRIENEDVYKVGIDMERELLSKLEIQNALPKGILAYLTVEEFRQYIKDDVLPEDIQKRSSFVLVRQSTDGEEVYSEKNRMKELGLIDEITSIDTGLIKGTTAFPGVVTGRVRVIKSVKDAGMLTDGEVLVACMTDPRYVTIMRKASAIITDEGGITCHAAIVSRELKKPCIIGTKIATQVLKDGDLVGVDADNGVVRVLERAS